MMNVNTEEFLWTQKYRPKTIDDCILPKNIKDVFKGYVKQGRIPNLLLSGTAGTGKTTIALAMCNEVGADVLFINGSDESGIDTFRNKITQFASTVSLTESKKVVIVDEFDYTSPHFQAIFRSGIEAVSSNCSFILTCNFKNRIIEPIHSRCTCIDFKIEPKDKQRIAAEFFKRVTKILENESIEFEPKVVAELITKFFPDYRRVLNELQRYSVGGRIDTGILISLDEGTYGELISALREKNFTNVRKWVGKNSDIESSELFRTLYDSATKHLEASSIPQLVLILGEYQYRAAFSVDQEINTMAALTEIMSNCSFLAKG